VFVGKVLVPIKQRIAANSHNAASTWISMIALTSASAKGVERYRGFHLLADFEVMSA
jgi:hypothetical protein